MWRPTSIVVVALVLAAAMTMFADDASAHVTANQIVGGSQGISATTASDPTAWPPISQVPPQAQIDADWAYAPPSTPSVPLPPRTISLSFDDGPAAETLDLASYLHDRGVAATFFVNGCHFGTTLGGPVCTRLQDVNWDPNILDQLVRLGHRVANHTTDHCELTGTIGGSGPCSPPLSATQIGNEVSGTQALLDPHILDGVYLFRAPANGWSRAVASDIDAVPSLQKLVGPFAYDSFASDWNCLRPDSPTDLTPADCAAQIVDDLPPSTHAGIIQLHDRNPNDPDGTYTLRVVKCLIGGGTGDCPGAGLLDGYATAPLDAIPGVGGTHSFSAPDVVGSAFADGTPQGWELADSRFDAIRLGNVDGDAGHRADVCGRAADGVWCATTQRGGTLSAATLWDPALSDANGFGPAQYGSTLALGDVDDDGKADLCMRGSSGLFCFRSTGSAFSSTLSWGAGDFSDANGWGTNESRWGSIRLVDIDGDGKADACGRSATGIHCQRFDGTRFLPGTDVVTSEFTDARGWNTPEYGATILFGDVDGNRSTDVCGRGRFGVVCVTANGMGGFGSPSVWSATGACAWNDGCGPFSDHTGWAGDRTRWRSVQLADIDGDGKADVCGRAATGIVCAASNGTSFDRFHYVVNTDFLDAFSWDQPRYGDTVQLADQNGDGKADVCARGAFGIVCASAP